LEKSAFFAPVSLVFFFAVLIVLGSARAIDLHPMNYCFLAAACFAFHLLFAYLADLLPVATSFAISASVSLLLVAAYLAGVAGWRFALLGAAAHFAFLVLFSYSFFHEGLSGITITVGAVATLAILMALTAKTDWNATFSRAAKGKVNA